MTFNPTALQRIFKRIFITFLFLTLPALAAKNQCLQYFRDLDDVLTVQDQKVRINLTKLTRRVAEFVKENKRAPTVEELSVVTKIDLQMLKGYLRKTSAPKILEIVAMSKLENADIFKEFEAKYAELAIKYLKKNFELPTDAYMAEVLKVTPSDLKAIYGSNKGSLLRMKEYQSEALDQFIVKILNAYTNVAKARGRSPTVEEVALELDVSVKKLSALIGKNKLFEKFEKIFDLAAARKPNAFRTVQNTHVFTEDRLQKALKAMVEGEVLVYTAGVAEAELVQGYYSALRTYYKAKNAPTFVRPVNLETTGLQSELIDSDFAHVIINTIKLKDNLSLHNLKLIAKMIDPLSGTKKVGASETRIFGHIQRRLETRASADSTLETLYTMTTGAITQPDHLGGRYIQERTAEFAMERHFYGAVILEKTSARRAVNIPGLGRFHIRMIEYIQEVNGQKLADPYFMDRNKLYYASGKIEVIRLEALMFGDLHFGATDQRAALEAKKTLIKTLNPKRIYTEDDYDGKEINHHERSRIITQGMLALMGANTLEKGLHYLRENIEAILEVAPPDTVLIRKRSNHPHWLEEYINEGWFMKEPQNTQIGLELATAMSQGMDPIDYFFKKYMKPENYRRVQTLRAGEPIYEGERPVLVSMHGDKGTNGAKGSMNAFIEATTAAIFGHTHYMQIYNRIMNIGAMADYPQPYAKEGFSKALIGNAGVGPNGEAQFYVYDRWSGEYFRDESKPLDKAERFFAPGYPYAVPTYDPTGRTSAGSPAGSADQYGRR